MNKKAIVLSIIIILAWAWVDRVIWGLMFDPNRLALIDTYGQGWLDTYHWGWADMLRAMILLGAVALYPHWRTIAWFIPSTWLIANSGLEDVLYYWMQGAAVPARLEWLDSKYWAFEGVTPFTIAVSVAAHILLAAAWWAALNRLPLFISALRGVTHGKTNKPVMG